MMNEQQKQHIELLAPAGSIEAFFAAVESGADAVYCGLHDFSARIKAKNFSLTEMEQLSAYAHQTGRRLYVTLNTLVKDAELPRLLEIFAGLASCRVDGLIIQDLGVWQLARDHFPELPLHASTQLTIHNAAGVRMLEEMGFRRAVLARELTLDEIAAIRRQTKIELEHFIHGALCYSISGRCLFSSWLAGKSGNRGRCLQPCRRRYTHQGTAGYYFSPDDFGAGALIRQLAAAGVMSFKIEGRMKNAEYVATVVTAYRKILDAAPTAAAQADQEAAALLARSFGRRLSSGFLTDSQPQGLVRPDAKGGIGLLLGTVKQLKGATVYFTTADAVHIGDRLRIQPESDRPGRTFAVQKMIRGKGQVKHAAAGSYLGVVSPFADRVRPGDQVFKVAAGVAFTLSEEACRRRLAAANSVPEPVHISACCHDNSLALAAEAAGVRFTAEYDVDLLPATHSPLSREILVRTFAKTGHPSLALGNLTTDDLPPVVIRPSRLNEIRRDFYARLSLLVKEAQRQESAAKLARAVAGLLHNRPVKAAPQPILTVLIANEIVLKEVVDAGVGRVMLPLTAELAAAAALPQSLLSRFRDRVVWELPPVVFEAAWPQCQEMVENLIDQGYGAFRLNNLGHFQLFGNRGGIRLFAGPWLYVLNSSAALALEKLGVSAFSLALEDDRQNMADILGRGLHLPASVTVFSPVPVLASRIPAGPVTAGHAFQADNGECFHHGFSDGLTVVRPARDFSLAGRLEALKQMGVAEFVVDLSGKDSSRIRDIIVAIREDLLLPDTSQFNFDRGLE